MATSSTPNVDETKLFEELDTYSWESDTQFQHYLSRLLGPNQSQAQSNDLTIRAKCFYYARKKKITIDFEAYKAHLASVPPGLTSTLPTSSANSAILDPQSSTTPQQPLSHQLPLLSPPESSEAQPAVVASASAPASTSASPEPPYPIPFASIVALITSGAPIPGIKEIPNTVLSSQATKPNASKRRKPWEKEEAVGEGEVDQKVEGTFGDRRDEIIHQDFGEEPLGNTQALP